MAIPLKFKASLDDSAFMAGIRRIKTAGTGLARGVGGAGRGAGRGVGGFLGIGGGTIAAAGAGIFARSIIKDADALQNLSRKTGMSTTSLAALAEMGKSANIEMEQLAQSVSFMQAAIAKGSPATIKALSDMGVTIDDLQGLKPEETFAKIGAAIGKMSDQNAKAAAARGMFGRGGSSLFEMFDDIANLDMSKVSENAKRMGESAKELSDFSDSLEQFAFKAKSYGASFLKDVVSGDIFGKIKNVITRPMALLNAEDAAETVTVTGRDPWKGFKYANAKPSDAFRRLTTNRDMLSAGEKPLEVLAGALTTGGLTTGDAGAVHGRVSRGNAARKKAYDMSVTQGAKKLDEQRQLLQDIKETAKNISDVLEEGFE
jgi:hypothetical protein